MTDNTPLNSTQQLLSHLLGKPWRGGGTPSPPEALLTASKPQPPLPIEQDEVHHPIEMPPSTATPAPLWRVISGQVDLSPTELQLASVMACNGFLAPATLARKSQLSLHQVQEALASFASERFVLQDGNAVALNVYAKQHLNLHP
jgi:hypothetical protein